MELPSSNGSEALCAHVQLTFQSSCPIGHAFWPEELSFAWTMLFIIEDDRLSDNRRELENFEMSDHQEQKVCDKRDP